jgi:hypothetical protein
MEPTHNYWDEWSQFHRLLSHSDRVPMMHSIKFEYSGLHGDPHGVAVHDRIGLSLNISSSGICLLVDDAPTVGDVWLVRMPSSTVGVRTPTLMDVRWVRAVPFPNSGLSIVGLKFIF